MLKSISPETHPPLPVSVHAYTVHHSKATTPTTNQKTQIQVQISYSTTNMSSIDMSAELVDALQAKVNEIERLETILKERDATIAKLKASEAALSQPPNSEGDGNGNGNYPQPTTPIPSPSPES